MGILPHTFPTISARDRKVEPEEGNVRAIHPTMVLSENLFNAGKA